MDPLFGLEYLVNYIKPKEPICIMGKVSKWKISEDDIKRVLVFLAFLVAIYVIYALKNYIRIFRFIFTLDGPKTVPILGNANALFEGNPAGKTEERQQKDLFDFCFKKMKEKREFLRKNGNVIADDSAIKKMSLLEYMVEISEKNPWFTEKDIIEECCTFMLAGQDSVGTAAAMTLFLLANNPKWQEKCVAELKEIFGDDRRSPTMQDLGEMKYLDMCIKESLRLYPSVPFFARTLGEDVRIG